MRNRSSEDVQDLGTSVLAKCCTPPQLGILEISSNHFLSYESGDM